MHIAYEPLGQSQAGLTKWNNEHKGTCTINYEGSAPSTEPTGVRNIYNLGTRDLSGIVL